MSSLGKIVGFLLAGRGAAGQAYQVPLITRLLAGIAAVAGLAMLCAILAGVLAVALLYGLHAALVAHGLDPQVALLVMAGLVALLTALLFTQLVLSVRRLRRIPQQALGLEHPLADRARRIGHAFIRGLAQPRAAGRSARPGR